MDVNKPKEYSDELRQVLERAASGEAGEPPVLSAAFDEHPELVQTFGGIPARAIDQLREKGNRRDA
jgi:hypothetical protein